MSATRWEYESFYLHKADDPSKPAEPEEIASVLNRFGARGFKIVHIRQQSDEPPLVILGRDTGRPIDEDKPDEWLVEVVTSSDSFLG